MSSTPPGPIREIEPLEAERLVRAGAVLLDVREPDEWAAGHAPAARHLPLGQIDQASSVVPARADNPVVVVCRSGARSLRAAEALAGAGYQATNLQSGMRAWAAAGLDVLDASGPPGQVI